MILFGIRSFPTPGLKPFPRPLVPLFPDVHLPPHTILLADFFSPKERDTTPPHILNPRISVLLFLQEVLPELLQHLGNVPFEACGSTGGREEYTHYFSINVALPISDSAF